MYTYSHEDERRRLRAPKGSLGASLHLKLPPDLLLRIRSSAVCTGINVSEWIRQVLDRAARP